MRISLETMALLKWIKDAEAKAMLNLVEHWKNKQPWAPEPKIYYKNKRFIAYEVK